MVRYSREPENLDKSAKARGNDLRVHFKNTFETATAIKGMTLGAAEEYLQNVIDHKDVIPFHRFNGGVGRCAQAKKYKSSQGRWPVKSCKHLLGLLQNLRSNADNKDDVDADSMVISHVQVNQARQGRRRTYRAHGRINAYMSCPCHIELFAAAPSEGVEKAAEEAPKKKRSGRLSNGASA